MPLIDFASRLQAAGLGGPAVILFVKSTLILAIGWLVTAALPRASAATRHLILTATLCSALLLPIVTMTVPSWKLGVLAAPPAPAPVAYKTIGVTGDEDDIPRSTVAAAVTLAKAAGVVKQEKLDSVSRAFELFKESWQGFVLLGIFIAALLLLGRVVAGVAGVWMVAESSRDMTSETARRELARAREHLGLKDEVRLLQSDRITVPVVWGFSRPILLLPASASEWPAERLHVVLLHELAHVRRGDGITLLLTRVAVALFWYQPLAWLLERDARAACERACDDLVLSSGSKPNDYADHLLAVAKTLPQVDMFRSVTLAMTRRSQLEGRLLSILEPHNRRGDYSARGIGFAALLAVIVTLPLAALQFVPAAPARPAGGSMDVVAAKSPKAKKYDKTPRTAEEWYSRGNDLLHDTEYVEAIGAFSEAAARGYRRGDALYNVACAYAQLDDSANAVKWLNEAWRAGYDDVSHMADDSDLDPIRETPQFQKFFTSIGGQQDGKQDRAQEALAHFDALQRSGSKDGAEWFASGLDLLGLRKLDESELAFQRAIAAQHKPQVAMYNLACVASRKGDVDAGLAWLEKSIAEGFDPGKRLDEDTDLALIRDDPRFGRLRTMAKDLSLMTWDWTDLLGGKQARLDNQMAHFREMTAKYPQYGRPWFNLGYASLQAGDANASVQAFQRSLQLGYRAQVSMYNIACAYARAGQTSAAIDWLYKSRAAGFQLAKYIDSDEDLDSLRDDPRFEKLSEIVRTDIAAKDE